MKKTKLILISLIILAVSFVIGVFIIDYDEKESQEEMPDPATTEADMTIKNIHYTKTNRGVKEWELVASSGQYFKDRGLATLKNVTVTIFFKDGKSLTLVGAEGKVATDTRDIEVWGDVAVRSGNRYQFHTKSLKYSSKRRRVFTPDKIFFTGYGMEIRGVGITIDIDRGRFFVLDNVSTVLKDSKKIKLDI